MLNCDFSGFETSVREHVKFVLGKSMKDATQRDIFNAVPSAVQKFLTEDNCMIPVYGRVEDTRTQEDVNAPSRGLLEATRLQFRAVTDERSGILQFFVPYSSFLHVI